ncbi:MAG: ATP-binding protein, partial [Pyrinomonadaceae bacterium]|nr:ATP-binding protein [Pyrinomonadaceae bacterium]
MSARQAVKCLRLNEPLEATISVAREPRLAAAPEPATCLLCFGSGMEVVPNRGARRCRCREQERQRLLLTAARLPRRHAHCSFTNYHPAPGNVSQLRAMTDAVKIVEASASTYRGLLLTGSVGTGKTHLSVAILRGLIEKGVPCLFYEFGALLK